MGGLTTRQLKTRGKREGRRGRYQLSPGDVLQERYEIIGILGAGGFSTVYKARDRRFANVTRLCAVKEMVMNTQDPQMREMAIRSFEREANILAALEHDAIPDVFDYFTDGDRSYLVLEFIRGKDLEAVLNESKETMTHEQVLDWAIQLCRVLSYLHNRSPQPVMFRDVKPSNAMLDLQGKIHLIDFNIAKVFQGSEKHTMVGTEGYSPPEQYRGESSPAGDIYALGASLHHLLTRQDPRMEIPFSFTERSVQAANSTVSSAFEAVIMRCLEYKAEKRYQNADELLQALQVIAEPEQSSQPARIKGQAAPAKNEGMQPLWVFKCEDEIRSMPMATDDLLLVGAYDNNLYALSLHSGEFLWKYPADDSIASRPEVYNKLIFITSADHHLYALNLSTGSLAWKYEADGPIFSSPRARYDHVFFGSDDSNLYAINVNSGREVWRAKAHDAVRSSPYIGEDYVYFGSEAGYVFAVDLAGRTKWQFQARRAVTSTPTHDDGLLFVGSQDHTVYAIDAQSGWAVWRFRTHRPIISSPVVHEKLLFIGSADGNLYAIDVSSGRQKWAYETGGQVSSSPAVWGDAVYVGSADGYVYSIDMQRGTLRWKFKTDGLVISSPTIKNGIVYIGSADHNVYALPA
jgi:outer membrane protein assembly factor BamB/tRNA A-37 threonylcarbamoyl transferase component Bud32